jgi:hypothetical protein
LGTEAFRQAAEKDRLAACALRIEIAFAAAAFTAHNFRR